ncbi:kinase-like protein [Rhizophagus irregularis]|nr:kinase-like protein [Rhizophagus irregularis]
MELVNMNNENSFNPTPRLKSNPIPIKFISFNWRDENCVYCGEVYIMTLFNQTYCKKCLLHYINDISHVTDVTDNNIYLDVYVDLECCEYYEISSTKVPQSIQGCCANCLKILCFKQIDGYFKDGCLDNIILTKYNKVIESEKDCKLCGKSLYQETNKYTMKLFKLCSDCYLISSECIESTLVEKKISIVNLPWWDNIPGCHICDSELTFTSDCQKYCVSCYIFYIGCRYCLTTNIVFGPACQTQCKKCKRISSINIDLDFDNFIFNNIIYDNLNKLKIATEFAKTFKKIDKYFRPYCIIYSILKKWRSIGPVWKPYSQFTNVEEITKGGYGIIYKAICSRELVILKRFENSKNNGKHFLNELKSIQQYHYMKCFDNYIIPTYGITKDPKLEDYIIVMKYASEGDLHKNLQEDFTNITWNKQKPHILWQISKGLENIHKKKFVHRDFHSGNILFDLDDENSKNYQWKIGDLGLSQAINNKSPNNEIYGVVPYIAPEIFRGSGFTKEADIYSLGMIMWELTTGCKPFDNVKHDHNLIYKVLDGERPKITEDTPECYANLMKSCWDPDPQKRPSIKEIRLTFGGWAFRSKNEAEFIQAEVKRSELIKLKKLGPEFAEKRHSEAIYTSRPLSAIISKCSSINSSSTISSGTKQDSKYISAELELDIDTRSLSSQNLNSTIRNYSTTSDSNYISAELELDIVDTKSLSTQNLSSVGQNFSTSSKRKNEVFLNINTYDNSGKYLSGSMLF